MTERALAVPLAVPAVDVVARAAGIRAVPVTCNPDWNELVLGLGDPDLRQGFEWGELKRRTATAESCGSPRRSRRTPPTTAHASRRSAAHSSRSTVTAVPATR